MSRKMKLWIAGGILAALGVGLARGLAAVFHEPTVAFAIYGLGIIVALLGLFLIAAGLTQR